MPLLPALRSSPVQMRGTVARRRLGFYFFSYFVNELPRCCVLRTAAQQFGRAFKKTWDWRTTYIYVSAAAAAAWVRRCGVNQVD